MEWKDGFVYKPPQNESEPPIKSTFGVKFSKDVFLLKSFLDKHQIKYEDSDLEETPMGLAFRIKRE